MSTALTLHRGARLVDFSELQSIEPPPATETFYPIKHATLLNRVSETLTDAGYQIGKQALALSADNHRFFATLDLRTSIMDGIALMIGIKNASDRSTAISFCAGERCFVCDNGSFSSEVVISRRHTRYGEMRFNNALSQAVLGLHQYKALAQERIRRLQLSTLSDDAANSYLLQSAEKGVVGWRLLPKVIEEWRNPRHREFMPRTKWSLFNSYTEVLKDRQRSQPARAAAETISLQQLLLKQGDVIDVEFTRPVEQPEFDETDLV